MEFRLAMQPDERPEQLVDMAHIEAGAVSGVLQRRHDRAPMRGDADDYNSSDVTGNDAGMDSMPCAFCVAALARAECTR